MILTKEVNIHIKGALIKRYKDIGYIVNTKDLNVIKVEDLPKNSQMKVKVKCDTCNIEKDLKIQDYYSSFKNNKYSCNKCKISTYKKTMLEKYGVENSFQLEEIKEKLKETKIKKYKDKNYNNRAKASETCLNKYGVKNPQQNINIKEKTSTTNLEKYGFRAVSKNETVKEKIKNTNLKKWNSVCTLHSNLQKDKIKEIFINKYGFDNPMKNKEIMIKSQISSLKRKVFLNTKLLYQSSYELNFLNNYYNKIIIENGKSIRITFDNKKTMYHSDFFIPDINLIIEIKSSYWYKKYYSKNIVKQQECEKLGYKYIIIIDKNYNEFNSILQNLLNF
jgi:hypothetical protein